MEGLAFRQAIFVKEYLIDLNATKAAVRAGYSAETAYSQGPRLLENVEIQAAIKAAMNNVSRKLDISLERILAEYAKIAFADLNDFVSFRTEMTKVGTSKDTGDPIIDYGQVVEMRSSDQVDGTMLNEISCSKDGTLRVRLHDKLRALDALAKYQHMSADQTELSGLGGGPLQVESRLAGMNNEEIEALLLEMKLTKNNIDVDQN